MVEEVVEDIRWTDSARLSFNNIVDYLRKEWTEKEVEKFIGSTVNMLSTLKRYPEICRPSQKRKNVRIGILNKRTQLVYHYSPGKKQIVILLFWDPKRNPTRFKY